MPSHVESELRAAVPRLVEADAALGEGTRVFSHARVEGRRVVHLAVRVVELHQTGLRDTWTGLGWDLAVKCIEKIRYFTSNYCL